MAHPRDGSAWFDWLGSLRERVLDRVRGTPLEARARERLDGGPWLAVPNGKAVAFDDAGAPYLVPDVPEVVERELFHETPSFGVTIAAIALDDQPAFFHPAMLAPSDNHATATPAPLPGSGWSLT